MTVLHHVVSIDITKTLPRIGDGRPASDNLLGLIVDHESGPYAEGTDPHTLAARRVLKYHRPHIGYHWVIDKEGKLYQTLELDRASYSFTIPEGWDLTNIPDLDPQHYNTHYDSVLLMGNWDITLKDQSKKDEPRVRKLQEQRQGQAQTLITLGAAYVHNHPGDMKILGRGEIPGQKRAKHGSSLNMDWVRFEVGLRVEAMTGRGASLDEDPRLARFTDYADAARAALSMVDKLTEELSLCQALLMEIQVAREHELRSVKERLGALRGLGE